MLGVVSEVQPSMDCNANVLAEQIVSGPLPNKKNQVKVPKKIHKAEREKLKRDQLNELFIELGLAVEPARQNHGKASILTDATRIVRDLLMQVESLRKENVALVKESHYVTMEKNELKDDNVALETEIARLNSELQEWLKSNPAWHNNGVETPVPAPLYVVPFHQDLQASPEAATSPKPAPQVTRPHARYPTPSDSWPMQILSRQQHSGDEGSDRT